ncbi:hypothetical protein SteCoe_27309 [Stentor coeruleus]|uniref:Ion transport domain-containing protein n=1 Tax=Stentor coeruleus TaxID=5963 RepID=A0A1R2BAR9_9CILI|nr:hypothetical protein SteCoe_27309 [Stentor coeruleus]
MSVIPDKNFEKIGTLLDDTIAIGYNKVDSQRHENLDIVSSMKNLITNFQTEATIKISSPFQGTCLQISKDEKRAYFGSRKEQNHQARIGVADLASCEIVLDEGVSESSVWAIALSKDENYIYASGQNPKIIKYQISDLVEVDTFNGHVDEVNKVIVTEDDKWIFSASDDGTVRMWSIAETNPRDAILLTSGGKLFSLDLSKDQNYLCCGGDNGTVTIFQNSYSLESPGSVLMTINIRMQIWALKISPNMNFIAVGDHAGDLRLYKFHTWENIVIFSHGSRIRDIDISLSENIVISASDNSGIKIWDVHQKCKEISFTKHTDWVKSSVIMNDQKHVISYGDDKVIMIWKLPKFDDKKNMDTKDMKVLHLWFSEYRKRLEGICLIGDDKFIISWESSGISISIMKIDIDDAEFCMNIEGSDEVFIAGVAKDSTVEGAGGDVGESYTMVCIYNVMLQKVARSYVIKAEMHSFYMSGDYLIIGESFKFTFWKFSSFINLKTAFAHHGEIRAIITAFNNTILFSFGTDYVLKKYSLDYNSEDFYSEKDFRDSFTQDLSGINYYERMDYINNKNFILELSDDSQYLFAAANNKFEIIYTKNFSLVFSNNINYAGIFKNLNNTLCLVRQEGMDIYSSKSFQILSKQTYDFTFKKIIIGADNRFLYFLSEDNSITRMQNPMKCKDITLVGDYKEQNKFQEHIESVINGKCLKPFLDSQWLIEPLHVNLLHIYAYFNLYDILDDAIIGEVDDNRIAFVNSKEGFSPLSVSLKMGFDESTEAIVGSLRKLAKTDSTKTSLKKLVFQVFEESLVELNIAGYSRLEKLYTEILIREDLSSLPNFCPPEITLPVLVKSDLFYPFHEDFNLSDEIPEIGVAILFSKTLMRFYLSLGSSKSIEFMKSIKNCPVTNIYYTKLIQLILKEKWKGVRWYMWIQAFVYLCYVIFLSLYTSYESCRSYWFLALPFIANALLYCYEIVFVIIGPLEYFSDFWNCVDTVRSWVMIIYSLIVWGGLFNISQTKSSNERYMLAILLFISWVRGITYFRINSSTRYLINLLFQVITDIFPFLIILFYSVVAFALMFRSFDMDFKTDFFPSLTDSYMILIGNWDNPTNTDFFSLILFFATLLNPIISLNLLIAILSDTFERVSEDEAIADGQELAEMIIEIETLMFWARNNNSKKFLHIMEQDSIDDDSTKNINKIINNINTKIFYIKDSLYIHSDTRDKLKEMISKKGQDLSEKLKELLYK